MRDNSISIEEARSIILIAQKINGVKQKTLEIIKHLGYIQIDTVSVIERAHHHVIWTRNQNYRPRELTDLVSTRKVFEYWSHAASYLPMSEYRYTLPMKREFKNKDSSWFPKDKKIMTVVLNRIRKEGALQSKNFENTKKGKTGWWDWKPAKKSLERLFLEGKLEITKREGFQKFYDLPERVIPTSVDISMPTDYEYIQFLIRRLIRHHGLANSHEIAYLKKKEVKDRVDKVLMEMCEDGELISVAVDGLPGNYFAFNNSLEKLNKGRAKMIILSPFDNLVIQRKKLKAFFDFDYQIECYVPENKRKFGYFCLPIFYGSKAIARIDCKADRKDRQLIVKSVHYENGVKKALFESKLNTKLKSFAKFNGVKFKNL